MLDSYPVELHRCTDCIFPAKRIEDQSRSTGHGGMEDTWAEVALPCSLRWYGYLIYGIHF